MTVSSKNVRQSCNHGKLLNTMPRPSFKPSDLTQRILPEDLFLGMLCLERKRAERSSKRFLLLLLDSRDAVEANRQAIVLNGILKVLSTTRRETDPAGWYKHEAVLGIIFTELGALCDSTMVDTLLQKVHRALATELSVGDLQLVHVSVHTFAKEPDDEDSNNPMDPAFYPDLLHEEHVPKISPLLKRAIDIVGSAAALVLFSPLFVLVALMVKLTSKGPVLFRQQRVGRFGVPFEFLKFRSMYNSNSAKIHEEYVRKFVAGKTETGATNEKMMYKIIEDPRVTRVGKFIRRTSLDELPQFWNALKGEMSLVGPRPSVPYETASYSVWHRRRLLEAKPGITGLWQVHGRSRTTFDEMVRLDLQYSRNWSLLLDLKILLQTPRAVLLGDGAY
jgi:lipopolysaccharide/colanic/teichoic acid biosynthesis glycosyltransferase